MRQLSTNPNTSQVRAHAAVHRMPCMSGPRNAIHSCPSHTRMACIARQAEKRGLERERGLNCGSRNCACNYTLAETQVGHVQVLLQSSDLHIHDELSYFASLHVSKRGQLFILCAHQKAVLAAHGSPMLHKDDACLDPHPHFIGQEGGSRCLHTIYQA